MNFKVYGVDANGLPFEQIEEEENRANHLAKQLKDENYSDVIVEEVWSSLDEMNEWIATRPKYYKFLTSLTANTHGWRAIQTRSLSDAYAFLDKAIPVNDTVWEVTEITEEEYRAL